MFYKVELQQFQLHVDWQMVGCHLRIAGLEFAADLGIEDIDLSLVIHEEDVVMAGNSYFDEKQVKHRINTKKE